jgi:hypothetical protein
MSESIIILKIRSEFLQNPKIYEKKILKISDTIKIVVISCLDFERALYEKRKKIISNTL